MNLLSVTKTYTKAALHTLQAIPFTVPEDVGGLLISFTYAPKLDGGLPNLITLTLDGPNGWEGTKHGPHEVNTFRIGKNSSPGFLSTDNITPGKWVITLCFASVINSVEVGIDVTAGSAANN